MPKTLKFISIILFFFSLFPVVFSQTDSLDSIRIVTYYPSPYGSYRELRTRRMAIGSLYTLTKDYCWPEDNGSYTCTTPIYSDLDGNSLPTPGGAEENAVSLIVDGNVGIGTATPDQTIQIWSGNVHLGDTYNNQPNNFFIATEAGEPGNKAGFVVSQDNFSDGWFKGGFYGASGISGLRFFTRTGDKIAFGTSDDFTDYTKYVENVTINLSGNVGIGTTEPKAKLEVNGGVKIGSDDTCNAAKAGTIRYNAGIEYCDGSAWKAIGGGLTYVGTKHSTFTLNNSWVTKDISNIVGQQRVRVHLRFVISSGTSVALGLIVRTPGDSVEMSNLGSIPGGTSKLYVRGVDKHYGEILAITDTLGRFEIKGLEYYGTTDMYILAYEPLSS